MQKPTIQILIDMVTTCNPVTFASHRSSLLHRLDNSNSNVLFYLGRYLEELAEEMNTSDNMPIKYSLLNRL